MPADRAEAERRKAIASIERDATEKSKMRSDVVSLYRGALYHLYQYKTYRDVRLVFAPELAIAGFGGDPDNFNYPRFDLDVSFYRVYENGKPVDSSDYFKWSKSGAAEGDLLFVAGHPGSTSRLDTVAHLEFLRDVNIPFYIKLLQHQHELLQGYGKRSEEHARRAKQELLDVENALKEMTGEGEGLKNASIMKRKIATENDFRTRHAEEFKKDDPYAAVAAARKKLAEFYLEERLISDGSGFKSWLFYYATMLVRLAEEDAKPDGERLPEFTQARRPQLEMDIFSPTPVVEDLEKLKFAGSIKFMQEELGDEHPIVKLILADGTPAISAVNLVQNSKLADVAFRKQLAAGGINAIADSKDPMIVLARAVEPRARELRVKFRKDVEDIERVAYERIARAMYSDAKDKSYPDATFTLRLSYGTIKGYLANNAPLAPFTNYAGLYERAKQHSKDKDFELPERWLAKKSTLNLDTPYNFVSTHDIIGGNSGSPVFNKNEEIVGLVFDGNLESLVGDFIYDESQNRTVSVDSRAIIEALNKMYGAAELVQELTK
jgi:hypothetical protein